MALYSNVMELFSTDPGLQSRFDRIEVELERTVSTAQRKLSVQRLRELMKGNGNALPLNDLSTILHIKRMSLWRFLHTDQLPNGLTAASILWTCRVIDEVRDHWDHILINWQKFKFQREKDAIGLFWPSVFHNTLNGSLGYSDRLNRLVKLHIKYWASSKK